MKLLTLFPSLTPREITEDSLFIVQTQADLIVLPDKKTGLNGSPQNVLALDAFNNLRHDILWSDRYEDFLAGGYM